MTFLYINHSSSRVQKKILWRIFLYPLHRIEHQTPVYYKKRSSRYTEKLLKPPVSRSEKKCDLIAEHNKLLFNFIFLIYISLLLFAYKYPHRCSVICHGLIQRLYLNQRRMSEFDWFVEHN